MERESEIENASKTPPVKKERMKTKACSQVGTIIEIKIEGISSLA